jgi:gamma-glutamylcyclotransferase (GGCT)/AIG2-like uncharacterized protein YtfP
VIGDGVDPMGNRIDGSMGSGDGRPGSRADGEFHLFVYGTLRSGGAAAGILAGSRLVGTATIEGTLYDLGEFPALMLYGGTPVEGEVWQCPTGLLWKLDEYEGVGRGLFRRVAIQAGDWSCWTYVAGPQLGRRLTPDRRMRDGRWAGGRPN